VSEYGSFCDVQIYSEVGSSIYMGPPYSKVVCVLVVVALQQINSNIPIPPCTPEASSQRAESAHREHQVKRMLLREQNNVGGCGMPRVK
jgi:hypothetical protein